MTDLADTGEFVKVRFLDAMRMHFAEAHRPVFSKRYRNVISDGDSSWGCSGNPPDADRPKSDDPPRFSVTFPTKGSCSATVWCCAPPLLLLQLATALYKELKARKTP